MSCSRNAKAIVAALAAIAAGLAWSRCDAGTIYVDNRIGDDSYLGYTATPGGDTTGPVRSIGRALRRAQAGDHIEIKNTGIPYHESIVLFGPKNSGYPHLPFTISGNGAVLDGSSPVPADSWIRVEGSLWKFTPWRKGHYGLVLKGQPVAEVPVPVGTYERPDVPKRHWCAWRGSIYYRADGIDEPPALEFRMAHLGMGISLYRVDNVVIRDLTLQNFRVDGVNVTDLSHNVVLDHVKSIENGRSGLFAGGTSEVSATNSEFTGNREAQVLIRALGTVQLEDTNISAPPVEIE